MENKNIHILPTDKPSRLIFNSFHKSFCYQKEIDGMYINDGKVSGADFWGLQKALNNGFKPQNIYITSDEEIKEGNYFLHPFNTIHRAGGNLIDKDYKKIILTTDETLIKDTVQAIDDEFLEWFVNNPSCEEVEVESLIKKYGIWTELKGYVELPTTHSITYKIIIPKEELYDRTTQSISLSEVDKQETLEELPTNLESVLAKITHQYDLGLSQWYEVVYYDNKWCSYSGSKTFEDGEKVVEWKYCKELL